MKVKFVVLNAASRRKLRGPRRAEASLHQGNVVIDHPLALGPRWQIDAELAGYRPSCAYQADDLRLVHAFFPRIVESSVRFSVATKGGMDTKALRDG